MQGNKSYIVAIIVLGLFSVSSLITGIMSRIESKHQAEINAKLEQQYQYATQISTINNKEIGGLYLRAFDLQRQNDSIRNENAALMQRMAASEARIAGIRKALEKPTRFSDSTKTVILKNLPE